MEEGVRGRKIVPKGFGEYEKRRKKTNVERNWEKNDQRIEKTTEQWLMKLKTKYDEAVRISEFCKERK